MGEFFRPCKRKLLERALKKLGLYLKEGAKHTKVICKDNGKWTLIPRHLDKDVKREIVESICEFIIEKRFDKNKLKKLLKWRK